MNGPHWIKQWIADLALLNDQFRNEDGSVDFSALGREEYQFRMALITRNFAKSERAKEIYEKAKVAYETNVERGKKGGRPRKDTTADGDTREDSLNIRDAGNGGSLESGTSANHYGDAATREGAEVSLHRESGVIEPTTISDFSCARESTRTDGHSLRVGNVARPPVRSGRKFRNKEEFIQWAIDTGLDPNDAGDCWEATMERGGLTKDGKKVDNICAYTVKWCRTSKKNRETA